MYSANPVGVVYTIYFLTKSMAAFFPVNWTIVAGIVVKIDANITGITPAELILIGKKLCFAPYALDVLFEYWIGILLSAKVIQMIPTIIII